MVEVGSSNLLIPTRRGKEIGDSTCLENRLSEIRIAGSIPVLGAMFLSHDYQPDDRFWRRETDIEQVSVHLSAVTSDSNINSPFQPSMFPLSYNGETYDVQIRIDDSNQTIAVKRTFREARAGSAFIYQGVPKTSDDMTFDLTQFDKSSYVVLLLYAIGVLDDRKP